MAGLSVTTLSLLGEIANIGLLRKYLMYTDILCSIMMKIDVINPPFGYNR